MILIGDFDTARALLDKRASIYSSRPRMVMAGELLNKGLHIMLRPFDAEFIAHQRLAAPLLSARASACYTPVQDLESTVLVKNLLDSTGSDFSKQYERFAASIVYSLTYGFRIETGEEWQLQTARQVLANFVQTLDNSAWIVNALPFLNALPRFLTPWKKTAEEWHRLEADLHMANMEGALASKSWNWSKDLKHAKEAEGMPDLEIAWDLGILCDAGNETTRVTLEIFTLACLAYPEFLPKAQEELDRVVVTGRLPDFEDLDKLPYVHAVVEETFRWRHLLPSGMPHATSKDDYYNGYFIPKGATVIPVFSVMRKDAKLFDAPLEFRPERWIGKSQPGNFGYGRRICTGRFIARNSLAIAIARILWAFDVSSSDGKRILVDEMSFTSGFVSEPKDFKAVFQVRSNQHREVVEKKFANAEMDIGKVLEDVWKRQTDAGLALRA